MSRFHTQRVSFIGSLGHRLTGRLECPDSETLACAVFAHCFTCSKDYIAATRVSRALASRGIAALRFDFTGLGDSEGDFAATNFSSNVGDVERAAAFLRESYSAPQLLIGHSLGGAAVLAAAGRIPEARVVATIAAPSEPAHIVHHFENHVEEIEREHQAEVDIAGRRFGSASSCRMTSVSSTWKRPSPALANLCWCFTVPKTTWSASGMRNGYSRAPRIPKVFWCSMVPIIY
ncbi:MAG: alpha/beta fold hydrolase [Gammaproteobacteria bacterium]